MMEEKKAVEEGSISPQKYLELQTKSDALLGTSASEIF